MVITGIEVNILSFCVRRTYRDPGTIKKYLRKMEASNRLERILCVRSLVKQSDDMVEWHTHDPSCPIMCDQSLAQTTGGLC
jgi:hypothetical protein